jgi:hypothetical protein
MIQDFLAVCKEGLYLFHLLLVELNNWNVIFFLVFPSHFETWDDQIPNCSPSLQNN